MMLKNRNQTVKKVRMILTGKMSRMMKYVMKIPMTRIVLERLRKVISTVRMTMTGHRI
jgi:hypothetical protein